MYACFVVYQISSFLIHSQQPNEENGIKHDVSYVIFEYNMLIENLIFVVKITALNTWFTSCVC